MKFINNRVGILMILMLVYCTITSAQVYKNDLAKAIHPEARKVYIDQSTGSLQYIEFSDPPGIQKSEEVIRRALKLDEEISLHRVQVSAERSGMKHHRFRFAYKGVELEKQQLKLHEKHGLIISLNTNYTEAAFENLPDQVKIDSNKAYELALDYSIVDLSDMASTDSTRLVYIYHEDQYRLVWKCDIYSLESFFRQFVYVDAITGSIIQAVNRLHNAETPCFAYTRYSGIRPIVADSTASGYHLHDYSRGDGIVTKRLGSTNTLYNASNISNQDTVWNDFSFSATGSLDAHWGAEKCYDYFFEKYQRDSFDGLGGLIELYVNYSIVPTNAFWSGSEFVFGNGGENATPYTSIDIVAHEFTHALTEYTADLNYTWESGSLNESFSDIFGVVIDHYARTDGSANFLLGDEVRTIPHRNMANPNEFGHPDTYLGTYWHPGADGIHTNSGVQNYWFYLLCEGGSGTNDLGNNYLVEPIGMETAAFIAYETLSGYLSPNTNYTLARFYSLQAAIDLFGECSNEAIAVAAAWHAVGIGEPLDAVVSNFQVSQTYACSVPVELELINLSVNAETYLWDFGNGTNSSLASTTVTYSLPGTYEITLNANDENSCNLTDSQSLIVQIESDGPLEPSSCVINANETPETGIGAVEIGTISNSSGVSSEGHEDFSCNHFTELIIAHNQPFQVEMHSQAFLYVLLDLNNDLVFSENEILYVSTNQEILHVDEIFIPMGSVLNTPLRLRFISSQEVIADMCNATFTGQSEDYSATIIANTMPPVANFEASSQYIIPGAQVIFTDLSLNLPTEWEWHFPGGIPSFSTEQNPIVAYAEPGNFNVKLISSNTYGSDTLFIPYGIYAQDGLRMCYATETSSPAGTITDSGGAAGPYMQYEDCGFLIQPACAHEITISFESFHLSGASLKIYDGPDENSPLIISSSYSDLPPDVTTYSGQMYLTFKSYDFFSGPGFVAHWTTIYPTQSPVADLLVSDPNPPVSIEISFSDNSDELPSAYFWDFGDGNTSTEKNPDHTYTLPGFYDVTLEVENCFGQDATSTVIEVQPYPEIGFNPTDTIFFEIGCDQQLNTAIDLFNNGWGDLVFFDGKAHLAIDTIEIAILGTHAFINNLAVMNALVESLEVPFKSEVILSSTGEELSQDLEGKDVLIVPQQDFYLWDLPILTFPNLNEAIYNFVKSGKTLIWASGTSEHIHAFWDVESPITYAGNTIYNFAPEHPIAQGINSFPSVGGTLHRMLDDNIIPLFGKSNDYDGAIRASVIYRSEKYGNLINLGYGFQYSHFQYGKILKNSIKFGAYDPYASWIVSMDTDSGKVAPNEFVSLPFIFNSTDLDPGIYYDNLTLLSNDPLHDTITYVIALVVREDPNLEFAQDTLFFEPIMAGTSTSQTITLNNVACGPDTMSLYIQSSENYFNASENQIFIAPQTSGSVEVFFGSDILGINNGYLLLDYGVYVDTLFLQGFTTPPPVQLISADTVVVELIDCQKYYTVNFDVMNAGAAELHFDITGSALNFHPLPSLKVKLDEGHQVLTDEIIRLFLFESGDTGFYIPYHDWSPYGEAGNILKTNIKDSIPYTNGEVMATNYFGENSSYFTAKYPGLFFMGAVLNGIDLYEIHGTFNGYSNSIDEIYTYELHYTNGFSEYTGFVYNTLSSNTSSLTHLIITESNENISYYADPDPDVELFRIEGLMDNKRVYQFTISTQILNGSLFIEQTHSDTPSRDEMDHIFQTFIDWIDAPEENLQSFESVVAPQSSSNIQFDVNTYTDSTELFIPIYISGNDPYNSMDTLIVHVTTPVHACADFGLEVINYCTGTVKFTNTSSKPADTWSWDFGDGTGSDFESPEHNFPATGIYTVVLEVCTNGVCNSMEKELDIILHEELTAITCNSHNINNRTVFYISMLRLGDQYHSSNLPTLSVNEDNRCESQFRVELGETYDLEIIRNYSYFNPDVAVWIDFNNDGQFQDTELAFYALETGTYTQGSISVPDYAETGVPLMLRTVVRHFSSDDPDICETMPFGHTEDHTLIIEGFPNAPEPVISYLHVDSCPGVYQFNFELLSEFDSCQWIFGDGTTSNELNPLHTYEEDGEYHIFLVIYSAEGVASDHVVINETASGIYGMTNGMNTIAGVAFALVAQHHGVTSFDWDFGDGTTEQTQIAPVIHTYAAPGIYTVTVSTDQDVCVNTFTRQIEISPNGSVNVNSLEPESFSVFPNPTDGLLYVQSEIEIQEFIVSDAQGREVSALWLETDENLYEINLKDLTPALYNLRIVTKNRIYTKKVVLQK